MDIKQLVLSEEAGMIALRRYFHENPELSQKEFKTMAFIEEKLHALGIMTVRVPQGGVIGTLSSGRPGATVLMRSDIDALPIMESETNLSKKKVCVSKNPGVAHMCGHDGHMSMLLTAAKILAEHRDEWDGTVLFMFEEAEEMGERGVGHLLRYLAEQKIHIDMCYGTHVMYALPVGKVAIMDGTMMAGAFFFEVKLHGKSGHGSLPHLAVSPIDAFTAFASELSAYRMRSVDPAHCLTYSFGMVQAGDTPNVIPDTLTFAGTARCFDNDDGLRFRENFWKSLRRVAETFGCTAEVCADQYFPVTKNTKECAELARRALDEIAPGVACTADPWMASETYAMTESVYPGIFTFTGIRDEEVGSGANHHTPEFDLAEAGLKYGVMAALSYVTAVLREKPETPSFQKAELEPMLALADISKPYML